MGEVGSTLPPTTEARPHTGPGKSESPGGEEDVPAPLQKGNISCEGQAETSLPSQASRCKEKLLETGCDTDLTEDTRFGCTRRGRPFYVSIVDDEMSRRLQEMRKLGPGLPKQGGIELA